MKVRKGCIYVFNPAGWDVLDRKPQHQPDPGQIVRVCHPHGCPPPNTMGHCHVEDLAGHFIGLVACASLTRTTKEQQ